MASPLNLILSRLPIARLWRESQFPRKVSSLGEERAGRGPAPRPFEGTDFEMLQVPDGEQNLGDPDAQYHQEQHRPVQLTIEAEPEAVEQRGTDERLQQIVAERQTTDGGEPKGDAA